MLDNNKWCGLQVVSKTLGGLLSNRTRSSSAAVCYLLLPEQVFTLEQFPLLGEMSPNRTC